MPFSGIVEPEQLAILTALVDAYCKEQGIDPASDEGEQVALLVMTLFSVGASTAEELGVALRARPGRAKKHYCSEPAHFLI